MDMRSKCYNNIHLLICSAIMHLFWLKHLGNKDELGIVLLLLLSHFSRVWPSATLWTAAFQAPPSMGFSRQRYWSGVPLPSPRHSPRSQEIITDSSRVGTEFLRKKKNSIANNIETFFFHQTSYKAVEIWERRCR